MIPPISGQANGKMDGMEENVASSRIFLLAQIQNAP